MIDHRSWLVLPTYNEADNIEAVLGEIIEVFPGRIVVVDDRSPDGTGPRVEALRSRWPQVELLPRASKLGLGSAYRQGLQVVLDRGADYIFHLDADGSHDPSRLPAMRQALDRADLVLASRYIRGGHFNISWHRKWISLFGNYYLRLLLGWSIHDWSTGYKGWRADMLRQVLAASPRATGYAWLMETTWLAKQLGGRITELPLQFRERRAGQSKFSWVIAREDLMVAWRLHHRRLASRP